MLTKAETAKLPAERQELLAQIELSKVGQREQVLKEARGHGTWRSGFIHIFLFIFGVSALVFLIFQEESGQLRGIS